MKIATEHPEAEREGAGTDVEEGFLFYGIALGAGYIAEGDSENAVRLKRTLQTPGRSFGDQAAMAAGIAADSDDSASFYVQLTFRCERLQSLSKSGHGNTNLG